jgi:hypothetical protein
MWQIAHSSRPEITRETEAEMTTGETKLRPIRIPMFLKVSGRSVLPSADLGRLEAPCQFLGSPTKRTEAVTSRKPGTPVLLLKLKAAVVWGGQTEQETVAKARAMTESYHDKKVRGLEHERARKTFRLSR